MLLAMTTGMATADGAPLLATVGADAFTGSYTVGYRLDDRPIGTRGFTIDERLRRIAQLTFVLDKYERRRGYDTMLATHRRLLDNLSGTGATITATVPADDSWVWAQHYDWAPDRAPDNAAALATAVAAVHTAVADQSVWDARDLPARVQALGGSPADDPDGADPWSRLVARLTPAELLAGLDAIQPGLGRLVFAETRAWYGQSGPV